MKKIFCIISALIATFGIPAHASTMEHVRRACDSLFQVLNTQEHTPVELLDLYMKICVNHGGYDIETAMIYGKKGLKLAEKTNEKSFASEFSKGIAAGYDVKTYYDSAAMYYDKSIVYALETKDEQLLINIYRCMVYSYYRQNKYALALEYCMKVLEISERIGDLWSHRISLYNIGSLYHEMGNMERAIQYINQAIDFASDIDIKHNPNIQLLSYHDLGLIYLSLGDIDLALDYELKAAAIAHEHDYRTFRIRVLQALSKIYTIKKDYNKAMEHINQSLLFAEEMGDPKLLVNGWEVLSTLYLDQKRYKECEETALKAWNIDSTALDTGAILASNIAIANVYMGNQEKAVAFFRKHDEIMKRYNDKNFKETMMDMEIKYETDKKEIRISALERQKILYITIGIAGVLLAITLWTISRQKIRQARQEKQLVASHAIMEGEKEERRRLARDLHDGLGGMLSAVKLGLADEAHLQGVRNKLDSCIDELDRLAHHLMPASLSRFGLKAAVEDYCRSFPNVRFHFFGTDRRIDEKLELVVYYCAYELMNNSFKHSGAKNIDVQLIQDDEHISLTVQDDGCGFDKESSSQGTGLKNLTDRVAAFNGKMDITTSQGNGTETNIELKIENRS